jgi:hypothetical protein
MDRMKIDKIAKEKACSTRSIHRLFEVYLNNPPTPQIKENNNCHLIIDGTYFGDTCLLNYFDNDLKHLQYFEVVKDENYFDFKLGLELLQKTGLNIKSITSDDHRGLIMAINEVLPHIVHQRCIIHVQRMSLAYLTRRPKYQAGIDLRKIIKDLHKVNSPGGRVEWISRFQSWSARYYDFLRERTISLSDKRLYKHFKIRQVRTLVNNTSPHLFYYLDNPNIPKSTNALESRFSYLKNDVLVHRGLSKKHRKAFLLWYNWFKYND